MPVGQDCQEPSRNTHNAGPRHFVGHYPTNLTRAHHREDELHAASLLTRAESVVVVGRELVGQANRGRHAHLPVILTGSGPLVSRGSPVVLYLRIKSGPECSGFANRVPVVNSGTVVVQPKRGWMRRRIVAKETNHRSIEGGNEWARNATRTGSRQRI